MGNVVDRVGGQGSASSPTRMSRRERWSLTTDPLRLAIGSCLMTRPMSAAEIAAEVGAEPERVRHQLRRLVAGGFATTVGKTRRRGVVETLYSCPGLNASIFSKEDLAAIGPESARQLFLRLGASMWKEAKAALVGGLMAEWPYSTMARIPLALDGEGWTAASERMVEAMEAIAEMREESVVDDTSAPTTAARISLVLSEIAEHSTPAPATRGPREADAEDRGERRGELAASDRWKQATTPTRIQILSILSLTPLTAAQIADRLPIPLTSVRGELRRLLRLGLVQVDHREIKGRTVEYTYAVDPDRLVMNAAERDALTPARRNQMHFVVVTTIFSELIGSIQDGATNRRDDSVIVRIPILVDEQLAARIRKTLEEAFESLMRIRSESIARWRASGGSASLASASLLFYPAAR